MKILIGIALTFLLPLQASQLSLRTVKQPLYLHGSESDSVIQITDVPIASHYADPEWRFSAISTPFVPASDGSWKSSHDVNLVSLYKIKVLGTYAENNRDMEVVIDASEAKLPEGYPFTVEQVIDAATTCVKLMYPTTPKDEGVLIIKVIPKK